MTEKQIYRRMNECYIAEYGDSDYDEWYGTDDPKEWKFYRPKDKIIVLMTLEEENKRIKIQEKTNVKKAIFTTTQSDLTKYNGTEVEVGTELTNLERDPEVGRMFHVIFNDETIGDAFEDELAFINNGKIEDYRTVGYHKW